ncbi:hypothetical protein [Streptomyces crystallinus]|uniref:VCBS repeat-containing protein n=1 Tax=Streptomyces crystallinus TaxID=68191 RepID=A0ABN1GRG7_9ACTN
MLWLYKGTGDLRKPFAARARVGGGWNQFNKLVGTGDVGGDGHSDLVARDTKGDLRLGLWFPGSPRPPKPFPFPRTVLASNPPVIRRDPAR